MKDCAKLIRLSDYTAVEKPDRELCREIQEQISGGSGDSRLVDLLDEEEDPRPRVFTQEDGVLRTGRYVGIFQYGSRQVQIGSRFDKADQPFFLWRLIELFLGESLLSPEDVGSSYGDNTFDTLLVAKLAVQLKRAWLKGGLRAYRAFAHNDSRMRGQLDISRHIRENMGLNNGRAAYRTREYSLNNAWNVLFLQAAAAARRRRPALLRVLEQRLPEFSAALRALEQDIPDWSLPRQGWVLEHTRQRITNPVWRDYEPARRTARAILQRMGMASLSGGSSAAAVTGVFLDIDRLWEEFVYNELLGAAQDVRHPDSRSMKEAGYPVWGGRLRVRPDFWSKAKGVVLDAKNRPDWGGTLDGRRPWERVNDDVYQVFFYMNALECPTGGVIFPVAGDEGRAAIPDPVSAGNAGVFWRVPVLIPKREDYRSFCDGLKEVTDALRKEEPIKAIAR